MIDFQILNNLISLSQSQIVSSVRARLWIQMSNRLLFKMFNFRLALTERLVEQSVFYSIHQKNIWTEKCMSEYSRSGFNDPRDR